MNIRTLTLVFAVLALMTANAAQGGIYSNIDPLKDTMWDTNYGEFERNVLFKIRDIRLDDLSKGEDSPMRRRYLLIEAMGRDGGIALKTVEQKLNYTAVLIRRGKAYAATQILHTLSLQQEKDFLVWSQLGTAKFLSGEFRADAPDCIKLARELWPADLKSLDAEQRLFLKASRLELDEDLEFFKQIELCLERLMRHRLREERFAKQKKPLPETVDPIFVDEDSKEFPKTPVKFLNEKGEFEVGRIAKAERAKLPDRAIQIVEQLMIWMPDDQRLLWLLGDVLNATAMDLTNQDERNDRIRDAFAVFNKMNDPLNRPTYGAQAIKLRFDALKAVAEKLPAKRVREVQPPPEIPKGDVSEWPLDWWRTVIVGFITGLAVGMFSIWQLQEIRRRRQLNR